jgi:hypothetical protein
MYDCRSLIPNKYDRRLGWLFRLHDMNDILLVNFYARLHIQICVYLDLAGCPFADKASNPLHLAITLTLCGFDNWVCTHILRSSWTLID